MKKFKNILRNINENEQSDSGDFLFPEVAKENQDRIRENLKRLIAAKLSNPQETLDTLHKMINKLDPKQLENLHAEVSKEELNPQSNMDIVEPVSQPEEITKESPKQKSKKSVDPNYPSTDFGRVDTISNVVNPHRFGYNPRANPAFDPSKITIRGK